MPNFEPTNLEIKNGPIWTKVEFSTFTGSRDDSPKITNEMVLRAEDIVWDVIQEFRDPRTGPEDRPELPINFAGDITQRDIFCFSESPEREIVASCFIKHREDFIGIKILWNLAQRLQEEFKTRGGTMHIRNYEVVAESFVEQHHPEIV